MPGENDSYYLALLNIHGNIKMSEGITPESVSVEIQHDLDLAHKDFPNAQFIARILKVEVVDTIIQEPESPTI